MSLVSVVIPAYNEALNLPRAAAAVQKHVSGLGHEVQIVLVDDGSRDDTWEVIEGLAATVPEVVGLRLSRNFGKEPAMLAGLEASGGDCVIVMDADLQHPPEVIPELLQAWADGAQVVHGLKRDRGGESWPRRFASHLIFAAARWMSGLQLQRSADFKLLDREVVRHYLAFREQHLFFRGLVDWLGFRTAVVEFDVAPRAGGTGGFSLWRLISYAANAIISFSATPLKIVSVLALVFFALSAFFGLKTLYDWMSDRSAQGFPTVILLIVGFGNFNMIAISVISWYVGKIYEETKMRPRFVLARRIGGTGPARHA